MEVKDAFSDTPGKIIMQRQYSTPLIYVDDAVHFRLPPYQIPRVWAKEVQEEIKKLRPCWSWESLSLARVLGLHLL
jgi:hypothetical protein